MSYDTGILSALWGGGDRANSALPAGCSGGIRHSDRDTGFLADIRSGVIRVLSTVRHLVRLDIVI